MTLLEALDDYNRHRIHFVIGYATPDEPCETLGEGQSVGGGKQIMRTKSVQKMLQKLILKQGFTPVPHSRLSHLAALLSSGAPACNLMMPLNGGSA